MSKNIVVNGVTYNDVESIEMVDDSGNSVIYYEGVPASLSVEETDEGAKIIATDKNGTTSATVKNGQSGVHVGSAETRPAGTKVRIDPDGDAAELVEVDASLAKSGYAADAKVTGERLGELSEAIAGLGFDHTAYGLPELKLTGDTSAMSKENAVTLAYEYGELSGSCTVKWQGSSSLAYEKKNYTIKFDNAFEAVGGWGAQKKYCLKANFIDHSHARNLICAKLWGQTVKSRAGADSRLTALPNAGAVDGFPIVISLNGEFHGLYTWNIPKDGWMFGMGSGEKEAFVCADVYSDAVGFKALATLTNDFELEYSSDGKSDWVLASLNNLIQMVMDSDGSNITKIGQCLDWDSAIDYYIHTVMIEGADNTKKNYILATYDGVKWFFSAYDMDSTFGLQWTGKEFLPIDNRPTFASRGEITSDKLMYLIWTYKRQALRNRYNQLRKNVWSENNVYMEFSNFGAKIPKIILAEDVRKYPSIPSSGVNDTAQILNYYRMRVALADEWIKNTDGELDLPTQDASYTNLVPQSVDTDDTIYNGKGYKDGYRLSSSGAEKEQSGTVLTGFIPCTKSDIIRLTGVTFGTYGGGAHADGVVGGDGVENLYKYLAIYNASKTLVKCMQSEQIFDNGISASGWTYPVTVASDIITFVFSGFTGDMAYIRLNATGSGADMIVTKNEEIV